MKASWTCMLREQYTRNATSGAWRISLVVEDSFTFS
jgi:hypothetical protein